MEEGTVQIPAKSETCLLSEGVITNKERNIHEGSKGKARSKPKGGWCMSRQVRCQSEKSDKIFRKLSRNKIFRTFTFYCRS